MKRLIFVICVFLLFSSCKDGVKFPPPVVKSDEEVKLNDVKLLPPPASPSADVNFDAPAGNTGDKRVAAGYENAGRNATVSDTSKKIVKDGTIQFETNDLLATRKKIVSALKKYGGYLDEDNQTINGDDNRKEYNLKIRIPAKYFDFLVDSVSSTADKIDSKNISVTDVTTRYIDIKSRLDNKKALEKRYLELLSKASKMSDLLEIEDKLTEIRSDIESTQGQLNYLSKQVAYSSLDITFYTKQAAQVDDGNGIGYKFKAAIAGGWLLLQNLFFGLINLWPVILFLGIIYWLVKRWRKRRKAKKAAN